MSERRIAVAFSGGRDSTALLHATVAAATGQGVQVLALHVHHGLSPNADAWLAHGEALCRRWARAGKPVSFFAQRLVDRPARGDSVEAWARGARYAALREMALAHGATSVLLAHHRRDQAETFLLQALRGAGVAGLAAMPRRIARDGVVWERPWLDRPRDEIDAYIRRHRLRPVEDDSNADLRFARNRLRLQVWPALTGAFDAVESTLAASATWAQQANAVLAEVAASDLLQVADAQGLRVAAWRELSPARRSNALRGWLAQQHDAPAPSTLVARLFDELVARGSGRWPFGAHELRLHRGVLRCMLASPPANAAVAATPRESTLAIRRAGSHRLPGWAGALQVERVASGGVPLAWLARCELRLREGGERFQAGPGRPPRSLKKQFQAAGVPMWERGGPLVCSGGQLVFVPGLGLDARVVGLAGQAMVRLRWVPDARPG